MPSEPDGPDRAFVDTNVFGYAHDPRDKAKHEAAVALIGQLSGEGRMVVSVQVINELCAILLRGKAGTAIVAGDIPALVDEMEALAEVVVLTPALTKDAADAVGSYGMSWYDALIWAAAKAVGCTLLYTEDVPGRPEIEGVRYVNPFEPADP